MIGRIMASAFALTGVAHAQDAPRPADHNPAPACTPLPACQQSPSGDDGLGYDAAFFAHFRPQNAYDMVRQTPGFALDGGDDSRGLSGALGNLLIDGARPSTKSQSLADLLSRIPADQVVRIELLRGAAIAGDSSGHAVLLNVVRTPSGGGGVWEIGAEYGSRPIAAPRGEISYNGRTGQFEFGLGASVRSEYRQRDGYRRVFDASGAHIESVETPARSSFGEWSVNGDAAFPLGGGRLSLNAQARAERDNDDNGFAFSTAAGAPLSDLQTQEVEDEAGFELGAAYNGVLGPWTLDLVGLINRETEESEEIAVERDNAGMVAEVTTQNLQRDTGETILRAALSRALGDQHIEFGVEGALNSMEQEFALAEDSGSGPVPAAIPNSNVLVEEERVDLFAAHTWALDERWTVETRLAWETSTLTFTGDADQSVNLSFWKPSLQISRAIGEASQLRLRVHRDVGQLNFNDFASAVSLSDSMITGGNPDLRPETSWRGELAADLRFANGAALGLTLSHSRYSDVNDRVLISAPGVNPGDPPIPFDAPGNIGDGDQTRLELNVSTPLDFVLPGARLILTGIVRDHEVTDPITGRTRIRSGRPESNFEIDFRHDIEHLRAAWGFALNTGGETQAYRFDEIETHENGPWITAFVETTALPNDMRLRLSFEDIDQRPSNRNRRYFTPDRNGAPSGSEWRSSWFENAPWVVLELNGAF